LHPGTEVRSTAIHATRKARIYFPVVICRGPCTVVIAFSLHLQASLAPACPLLALLTGATMRVTPLSALLFGGDHSAGAHAAGQRLTCYVPAYDTTWGPDVFTALPVECTHINLAFAISHNGKFDPSDVGVPTLAMKKQVAKLQAAGTMVSLSIGGWGGRDGWTNINNTTKFADDALTYLRSWAVPSHSDIANYPSASSSMGLDGIDLDVEASPMSSAATTVAALVKVLRPRVKVLTWAGWMGGSVPAAQGGDTDQDSTMIFAKVGTATAHRVLRDCWLILPSVGHHTPGHTGTNTGVSDRPGHRPRERHELHLRPARQRQRLLRLVGGAARFGCQGVDRPLQRPPRLQRPQWWLRDTGSLCRIRAYCREVRLGWRDVLVRSLHSHTRTHTHTHTLTHTRTHTAPPLCAPRCRAQGRQPAVRCIA
jgi:hypothetical protein